MHDHDSGQDTDRVGQRVAERGLAPRDEPLEEFQQAALDRQSDRDQYVPRLTGIADRPHRGHQPVSQKMLELVPHADMGRRFPWQDR